MKLNTLGTRRIRKITDQRRSTRPTKTTIATFLTTEQLECDLTCLKTSG